MAISRNEQETIFIINEEDEIVSIYTASPIVKRMLIAKGFKQVHNLTKRNKLSLSSKSKEVSWEFECLKRDFRFGLKTKRNLTDEQREELKQRAKKNLKSKKNSNDNLS